MGSGFIRCRMSVSEIRFPPVGSSPRACFSATRLAHLHERVQPETLRLFNFSGSDLFARGAAVFRRPCPILDGQRRVDGYLPAKPSAEIAERAGVFGAKDDLVFRLQSNDEILAIESHRHLSPVLHGPFPHAGPVYSTASASKLPVAIVHLYLCRSPLRPELSHFRSRWILASWISQSYNNTMKAPSTLQHLRVL